MLTKQEVRNQVTSGSSVKFCKEVGVQLPMLLDNRQSGYRPKERMKRGRLYNKRVYVDKIPYKMHCFHTIRSEIKLVQKCVRNSMNHYL